MLGQCFCVSTNLYGCKNIKISVRKLILLTLINSRKMKSFFWILWSTLTTGALGDGVYSHNNFWSQESHPPGLYFFREFNHYYTVTNMLPPRHDILVIFFKLFFFQIDYVGSAYGRPYITICQMVLVTLTQPNLTLT